MDVDRTRIVYKSRRDRDRVIDKVMKDPRMAPMMESQGHIPFDGKRMFWGDFRSFVEPLMEAERFGFQSARTSASILESPSR